MYAYLVWSILLGIIWLILYFHRKDLRYEILFSSILFLPFGLTQPLFVPEYWNPVVIFKFFGLFDIESLLWCFFTGGIVAVLYEEIFKKKLMSGRYSEKSRVHAYVVYFLMILTVLSLICVKHYTSWSVLRSSFIFAFIIYIYFIYTRRDLIIKSTVSGIIFMIFYIISLLTINLIFPGFVISQWTIQGSIGIRIFSIVIEEYVYAFLFGLTWSIVYEEIKNIKFKEN